MPHKTFSISVCSGVSSLHVLYVDKCLYTLLTDPSRMVGFLMSNTFELKFYLDKPQLMLFYILIFILL